MSTLRRLFTGLAITGGVFLGLLSACDAQPIGPVQSLNAPNGLPAVRCSRPAGQEALRIKQLVEFLEKTRSMATQNRLLLADVAYYEAELAASRRCLQSVAAQQD
jgi:hypothetical protein